MRKHVNWVKRWARLGGQILSVALLMVVLSGLAAPAAQALTEDQRLVNEVWRIIDRAYVDSTFNHQNWWGIREKVLKKNLKDRATTYGEIQTMLALLDDPFTRLLRPDQYRSLKTSTSGELTGVGLQIALEAETKQLQVISPIAGSPAEKAGIQAMDLILNIDGEPALGLSLDEAAERMRGKLGSVVQLQIQRARSATAPQTADRQQPDIRDYDLVRDRIELNPVVSDLRQEAGGKVGYIRLTQFNANATAEVASAIRQLESQGAAGYVLDLRNNPGGLLQAGVDIARDWLDEGTIVYTVNRQGTLDSYEAAGAALTDDPLVVLVNPGTASASEILAGALQDNHRGVILGEKTFGKGLIQSLFDLSDGSGLAVTVAKYETPDHRDINKLGIMPDQVVELRPIGVDQLGSAADSQYQAAIKVLAENGAAAHAS
jgi:carboxyl-terminal processing protease